jgi:hypothetical protein
VSTFAPKQGHSRQVASLILTKSHAATSRVNHVPHPILPLQRTIGNRAIQRLLRTNAEAGSNSTAASPSANDFSRSPEYRQEANAVREAAEHGTTGGSGPLPHSGAIQRSFGRHDVRGVRAYVGGLAAGAARAIGAAAYAMGNAVAFGRWPDLYTAAHEAAHVVQQRAGVSLAGGVGQQGDPYEQHADAVAARVAQGRTAEDLLDRHTGSGSGGSGVQRFAFVNEKQVEKSEKGLTAEMKAFVEDTTTVRNYTGLDEFKKHAGKDTDYLGNLPDGTWMRFSPTGTNLLGENHTKVSLEKVLPAVGSKSFIYEQFSADVLKAGSNTKSVYEGESKALFNTFGVENVKDKQQFGAESLFPKMGFALAAAIPYFEGKVKMADLDPNGYFGQPVQRYLKIAWGHSKDNKKVVEQMRKAKQKIPPKMDALATVHAAVESKLDPFITALIVDGHIETQLDKKVNAGLRASVAEFVKAFTEVIVEMAATEKSSRLSAAERKTLAASTSKPDEKIKLFSEWRDFLFEDNVKAATKRGVRYAGMGQAHLDHLVDIGLAKNQHPFEMDGKDITAFKTLTGELKKAAKKP